MKTHKKTTPTFACTYVRTFLTLNIIMHTNRNYHTSNEYDYAALTTRMRALHIRYISITVSWQPCFLRMSAGVVPPVVCVDWRPWSARCTPQTAAEARTTRRRKIRLASRGRLKWGTKERPTEVRPLPLLPSPWWCCVGGRSSLTVTESSIVY